MLLLAIINIVDASVCQCWMCNPQVNQVFFKSLIRNNRFFIYWVKTCKAFRQKTRLQTCALQSIDPANQLPDPRFSADIAIDSFLVCNSTARARRWNVKLQVILAETGTG